MSDLTRDLLKVTSTAICSLPRLWDWILRWFC
jgi:hypothetical protein